MCVQNKEEFYVPICKCSVVSWTIKSVHAGQVMLGYGIWMLKKQEIYVPIFRQSAVNRTIESEHAGQGM
jgi:hypothetical protein